MLINGALDPFKWLFLAVLLRACNQVLMKFLAVGLDRAAMTLSDVAIICSILLILVARAVCWQRALSRLPLSTAYPFFGLTLITLMLSGDLLFDEEITLGNWFGVLLIIIGVFFISSSYKNIAHDD